MNELEINKKNIKGYEGLYAISDCGIVLSIKKGYRPLAANYCQRYHYVTLSKNNVQKRFNIHRLVALHFVDGYKDGLIVNHIDGVKSNNHHSNLEWITHKQNCLHAKNLGLIPPVTQKQRDARANNFRKSLSKPIECLTLNGEFIREYPSANDAAKATKSSQGNISMCCLGKRPTAKGFKWRYANG